MDKLPSRSSAATKENARRNAKAVKDRQARRAKANRQAKSFFSSRGAHLLTGGILSAVILMMIFTYIIYRIDPSASETAYYWKSYTGHTIARTLEGHEDDVVTLYYYDIFAYMRNFTYAENLNWSHILGLESWDAIVPQNWTVLNALIFMLNLFVFSFNAVIFTPLKFLSVVNYYIGLLLGLRPEHWFQIANHWIFTDLNVPLLNYVWQ